ncbi:uncharacterized protein AC631_03503 [Debaryomyces fabryi]|uniref:Uncharacterized protein n=1 Tax=Debaryomyces fabryi TaxID=58627 RepID=A0A0V1PWS5_9ASCO|nr:uncharacterized protein AC631_03503 [Debaryomyces fabryi]KSA00733.1 hypothetical protein AC631_03503 [Debaryomyces fabryi]
MAKSQRDLKGWQYFLDDAELNKSENVNGEPTTPSRRSRRGKSTSSQKISLKRDEDELEIREGDFCLFNKIIIPRRLQLLKRLNLVMIIF